MLVSNGLFDAVLFGVLLLAAVLDGMFPALHGAASLLAVGVATYVAAQELSTLLDRRGWWTQESLATSLALCAAGFIYYWWRNQSDLALLMLSVGLMMASLMVTIAVIASFGVALRDASANAVVGLLLTTIGALGLGVLAGLLVLALGRAGSDASPIGKIIVVALALMVWKLRETLRPPAANAVTPPALAREAPAAPVARNLYGQPIESAPQSTLEESTASRPAALPHATAHPFLLPQRGTLLDRFLPALVLGALLFVFTQQGGHWLVEPFSPSASADNRGVQNSKPPSPHAFPE